MSDFILEIGSEELPARFLPDQEKELRQRWGVLATIVPKPPVQEAEMRCSGQRPAPRAR